MAVRLLLSVAVCACVASWAESFGISTGHWHKNPPCRKSCCDAPKVTDDWGNCAKYKANEWCKTDGSVRLSRQPAMERQLAPLGYV